MYNFVILNRKIILASTTQFYATRCLFVTFTLGFAILSAWITNVADVIYLQNVKTDNNTSNSIDKNQVMIRSYTQKVKQLKYFLDK